SSSCIASLYDTSAVKLRLQMTIRLITINNQTLILLICIVAIEHIAQPPYGFNQLWMQLFTQTVNMHFERVTFSFAVPAMAQLIQIAPGQNTVWVQHKIF